MCSEQLPAQLYQYEEEGKAEWLGGKEDPLKAWITFMDVMNVIKAHAFLKTKQVDLEN